MERLLTVREASQALRLCGHTIRAMVKAGRLPAYRIGEKKIFFEPADLEGFIKNHKIEGKTKRR